MRHLDWAIVAAYLLYVVWDGIRLSKKTGTAEGFFLGGRNLPWWAIGLSVMATQMSAITLVGATGQAYDDGLRFLQFYYGMPLALVILCVTVVPFFYKAKVFTAYEYLEKRFDAKTRALTSFCFLMSRGMAAGVVIAAPSVVLSRVFGISEVATIFTIGLTTTVYTMIGGVQAVTWTDVKQMILIFFGIIVCVIIILSQFPANVTFTDGLFLAGALGKLETVNTSFDLTEKYTIWSGTIAALFLFLSYFGCDQSQVQRFLTAKSVNEGRTSLLMSAFLKIPMQFGILLIGILVFIFYQFTAPPVIFNSVEAERIKNVPAYSQLNQEYLTAFEERRMAALAFTGERSDENRLEFTEAHGRFSAVREQAKNMVKETSGNQKFNDVNYIFPSFILENMPLGIVGLFIAIIFAAAMSSISSELNSLATASTMDFYRRFFRSNAESKEYVIFGRFATFLWGMFACVVAIYATNLGSLIEVVNTFGSYFYGSLLGVFVLAIGTKRARGTGAFLGLICGMISIGLAHYYTNIEFLWFNLVGCVVTVTCGYLISLVIGGDTQGPEPALQDE